MRIIYIVVLLLISCKSHLANVDSNTNINPKNATELRSKDTVCPKLLNEMASAQAAFLIQLTKAAVPVNVCENTKDDYASMINIYKTLKESCADIYFDKDRLNVVATVYNMLIGLLEKAYCDDCFTDDHIFSFNDKVNALSKCFRKHTNETVCVECLADYEILNGFYTSLDQHNNGRVCFDMQDMMNRTRSKWSKDFQCCKRESHSFNFLAGVSIISVMPMLFYLGVYKLTKRLDQHHGILNDDPVLETTNVPSTSAR